MHYVKLFLGSALMGLILFLGIFLLRRYNKINTAGTWIYFIFWVLILPLICVLIFYLQETK
jgi:cell division protein FtsW (lipid II flippase)